MCVPFARSAGRVEIEAAKMTAVEVRLYERVPARVRRQSSDALMSCEYTPPASKSLIHRQGRPAGCGNTELGVGRSLSRVGTSAAGCRSG